MKLVIGNKTYEVKDLKAAKARFLQYRGTKRSSRCHNGIVDNTYRISYNGRIWVGVEYVENQQEVIL